MNYESSGTTTTQRTFIEGETLEPDTEDRFTAVVGVNGISKPISTPPVGQGSLFTVKEGYYFIDGSSVRCDAQTITLEKYSIYPTYSVGFLYQKSLSHQQKILHCLITLKVLPTLQHQVLTD